MKPYLNILVAWPYVKADVMRHLQELGPRCRFFLDSGAFTAFKAGKSLSLDDYCRFVETLPVQPWRYFALDVIGNPSATMKNYEQMLARGFNPVPVFTRGEDPSVLDEYYQRSEVVGLGGVAKADRAAYAWTRWAMSHVRGRKVHILGFTNLDWVKYLAPYSVDSSSWTRVGRFGWLDVYLGHGKMSRVMVQEVRAGKRPPPAVEQALAYMGFDPHSLQQGATWKSSAGAAGAHVASAASWIACSMEFERTTGTKIFLASPGGGGITDIRLGLAQLERANHPSIRDRPDTAAA